MQLIQLLLSSLTLMTLAAAATVNKDAQEDGAVVADQQLPATVKVAVQQLPGTVKVAAQQLPATVKVNPTGQSTPGMVM